MNANLKQSLAILLITLAIILVPTSGMAQLNTGSDGSDGAFNPATDTVINMTDHPNGIYQYTNVNIPSGVTVTFIPNANNTPVVWLVRGNVTINGTVNISGQNGNRAQGGLGGPGGWQGGCGAPSATAGQGPGGGTPGCSGNPAVYSYGNKYLIPLLGGSGGGGDTCGPYGAGGGGGAILIAASSNVVFNGNINANGGTGNGSGWSASDSSAGDGSGGAIRLVSSKITGGGTILCVGGGHTAYPTGIARFDTYDNEFYGTIQANFTQGSQFIVMPSAGQLPQVNVTSVGGVSVSASPTGVLSTPDTVLSAQQNNPVSIIVNCVNLPLHSLVTVTVKPATGLPATATTYNDTGTTVSSTATVSINIPRGGGLIYATASSN